MEENFFLTDWNETQTKKAKKEIAKYLRSRKFYGNYLPSLSFQGMNFKQIDKSCGFAYTSSGECAGLFICNIELYIDINKTFSIYGFIMDNNILYALCNDKDGNEITMPINE